MSQERNGPIREGSRAKLEPLKNPSVGDKIGMFTVGLIAHDKTKMAGKLGLDELLELKNFEHALVHSHNFRLERR